MQILPIFMLHDSIKNYLTKSLRQTLSGRANIRNPRGFFLMALERGDYGYKLAKGARILGNTEYDQA
jgi:hypothetical protein